MARLQALLVLVKFGVAVQSSTSSRAGAAEPPGLVVGAAPVRERGVPSRGCGAAAATQEERRHVETPRLQLPRLCSVEGFHKANQEASYGALARRLEDSVEQAENNLARSTIDRACPLFSREAPAAAVEALGQPSSDVTRLIAASISFTETLLSVHS